MFRTKDFRREPLAPFPSAESSLNGSRRLATARARVIFLLYSASHRAGMPLASLTNAFVSIVQDEAQEKEEPQ